MGGNQSDTSKSDLIIEYVVMVHENHQQTITELKERQWSVLVLCVSFILALGGAYLQFPEKLNGAFIGIAAIIVSLFASIAILHMQKGLKLRRAELAHLKDKIGPPYNDLRLAKTGSHILFRYDWPIWGLQIALITIAGVGVAVLAFF